MPLLKFAFLQRSDTTGLDVLQSCGESALQEKFDYVRLAFRKNVYNRSQISLFEMRAFNIPR